MDPDGRIVVDITWQFNMQGNATHGSTEGLWGNAQITRTTQLLSQGGCAITLIANIVATNTGNTNVTPGTINGEPTNFLAAGLYWQEALDNSGVTITAGNTISEQLSADRFNELQESPTSYFIGLKVRYDQSGQGEHWVGANDIVTRNGQQFFSITPTSANDSILGTSELNNRGGRGWQTDVNAQGEVTAIYVPLDQVQAYKVFTIQEPIGE